MVSLSLSGEVGAMWGGKRIDNGVTGRQFNPIRTLDPDRGFALRINRSSKDTHTYNPFTGTSSTVCIGDFRSGLCSLDFVYRLYPIQKENCNRRRGGFICLLGRMINSQSVDNVEGKILIWCFFFFVNYHALLSIG